MNASSKTFSGLDSSSEDEETIWRRLFYATMANPRNLGYILHFLYADVLIHGDELSLFSINKAAQRYFDEKIEPFFAMSRFTHLSFQERSSVYSLKELLERFVSRARITQREMRSEIMQKVSSTHGRPPTSHFHVITAFDSLLSTLELNFFVTKYYEMKDRDGREVSVYALNFGLCERYSIALEGPEDFGKRVCILWRECLTIALSFDSTFRKIKRSNVQTADLYLILNSSKRLECSPCAARAAKRVSARWLIFQGNTIRFSEMLMKTCYFPAPSSGFCKLCIARSENFTQQRSRGSWTALINWLAGAAGTCPSGN